MKRSIYNIIMPLVIVVLMLFVFQYKSSAADLNLVISIQKDVISDQDTLINGYRDKVKSLERDLILKDVEIKQVKKDAALRIALDPLTGLLDENEISDLIKEIPHGRIFSGPMGITASFGESVGFHGKYRTKHKGLDVIPLDGDFKTHPFADGVVERIGEDAIYGKFILIKHTENVYSFYGHQQKIFYTALPGETVTTDTVIGIMGDTGLSDGKHVHFEIRCNTGERIVSIDPEPFFIRS